MDFISWEVLWESKDRLTKLVHVPDVGRFNIVYGGKLVSSVGWTDLASANEYLFEEFIVTPLEN